MLQSVQGDLGSGHGQLFQLHMEITAEPFGVHG